MGRPKKRKPPRPDLHGISSSNGSGNSTKNGKNPSPSDTAGKNAASKSRGGQQYVRQRNTAEQLVEFPAPSKWPTVYWQVLAGFAIVFLYSYWPTILWMVDNWINEPDYSHGWAVPFLAGMICVYRSETFPGVQKGTSWAGLSLILLSIFMRVVSRFTYTDFLDAWSMLPLIAGVVWCLLGYRAMWWAAPAIGFLFFAFPMPYQAESMLSWRLQGVATDLSTIMLRVFGQPAVAEGHVVWVGNERLSIEQACSGLRIFVGMGAFAVLWAAVNMRGWSDKIVILLAAIPAAILVNSARIVLIGFGYVLFDDPTSRRWIHDLSGIAM
ncbi:MAG: exosortase/archaeosortase family protein, partial [Planctomycetales bacterium]|nr:exosortase/archaeosortase family protein [Planctomycetales bacterium]